VNQSFLFGRVEFWLIWREKMLKWGVWLNGHLLLSKRQIGMKVGMDLILPLSILAGIHARDSLKMHIIWIIGYSNPLNNLVGNSRLVVTRDCELGQRSICVGVQWVLKHMMICKLILHPLPKVVLHVLLEFRIGEVVQRLPCEPIGNCQQFFQDSRQLLLH